MTAMTNYLEDLINQWVYRNTALAARGTGDLKVGLFTAAPSDAGGGTEVSGGSYARATAPATSAWWTVPATPGAVTNAQAIIFPTATASWGTITHVAIFDNAGNMLFWGALSASKTVDNTDSFQFATGQLSILTDN